MNMNKKTFAEYMETVRAFVMANLCNEMLQKDPQFVFAKSWLAEYDEGRRR